MTPAVHVLVGLISDAEGRWLVNSRRPGQHMAGFWEFPGGKSHRGEERFDALRRELNEELGIEVLRAEPFMALVHDYPEKRVELDIWRITSYRGAVHGREGQELRWVAAADLADAGMLPADRPIVDALRSLGQLKSGSVGE